MTDVTRCEDLARLYEIEQGRFPFLVGSIQGKEALGCDLVSFATELERSEFEEFLKQGKIDNLARVVRFIEVKGRGNPNGAIAFEGGISYAKPGAGRNATSSIAFMRPWKDKNGVSRFCKTRSRMTGLCRIPSIRCREKKPSFGQ